MTESPRVCTESQGVALAKPFTSERELLAIIGGLFFFSGAAALVYQVLFSKQLALVFGSTATAAFTVLATFLGGMALGSLMGGAWAVKSSRPLCLYAGIELAIGSYCIATPLWFDGIQHIYVFIARGADPEASSLLFLRVALGSSVLLVPTLLMGATLPLLVQALRRTQSGSVQRVGEHIARLYLANTGGAAVGALLAAYVVIPSLGASRTAAIAAGMNAIVAAVAWYISMRQPPAGVATYDGLPKFDKTGNSSTNQRLARWVAWLVLGIGGVLSLGLEVVYVHMLSVVAGNSVYAFGLMVGTFLMGLSTGGGLGKRLIEGHADALEWPLVWVQLGLAATIVLGAIAWDLLPSFFSSFEGDPRADSFVFREAMRALVCIAVMAPPTLFIGASYTLAMDMVTAASTQPSAHAVGVGAAINTLGNIAGVLIFGFILLPWVGGLESGQWILVGALFLAALCLVSTHVLKQQRPLISCVCAGVGAVLVWAYPKQLDYTNLASGANVYFAQQGRGQVIDHAESIDGGLTAVASAIGSKGVIKTLLTNGKFQGNDALGGEMQAQIGIAVAPLLHTTERSDALVIGYGTGVTSRVFHEAGFTRLDIAELSGDVIKLANRHFAVVNQEVTRQPGVHLHITDGRNFLLLSEQKYDVISIEISSIWFAGAASLYNREFYELVQHRLRPHGVLQQWLQLHRLTPDDLRYVIGTLRSSFRFVSLYVIGGQGILVATNQAENSAPSPNAADLLKRTDSLSEVRRLLNRSVNQVAEDQLLGPKEIDLFLEQADQRLDSWISTDDNLRLEYDTPKANVNPPQPSFQRNLFLLSAARGNNRQ